MSGADGSVEPNMLCAFDVFTIKRPARMPLGRWWMQELMQCLGTTEPRVGAVILVQHHLPEGAGATRPAERIPATMTQHVV